MKYTLEELRYILTALYAHADVLSNEYNNQDLNEYESEMLVTKIKHIDDLAYKTLQKVQKMKA